MAADATHAYIQARAQGKDVAILCDTWEIADAINQLLWACRRPMSSRSVAVRRLPTAAGAANSSTVTSGGSTWATKNIPSMDMSPRSERRC
jgi:hypothetical protein